MVRASSDQVVASYVSGIGSVVGQFPRGWRRGIVAIEQRGAEFQAIVGLGTAGAVVGNEESEADLRHQMQVAMKILRVAAMADDAVAVARLLVKSERHPVHLRQRAELATVHQPC